MKKISILFIFIFSSFIIFAKSGPYEICPKKGEIYLVDFGSSPVNSEIYKIRPALIISDNNINNGSRVIVAPLTTKKITKVLPFQVLLKIKNKKSKILFDQLRAVDKSRLIKKFIKKDLNSGIKKRIDRALKMTFALDSK